VIYELLYVNSSVLQHLGLCSGPSTESCGTEYVLYTIKDVQPMYVTENETFRAVRNRLGCSCCRL